MSETTRRSCGWAESDPEMLRYHDEEWGVPTTVDDALFERLTLELFQAGLSWRVILYKRPAFRMAFASFSLPAVAAFTPADVDRLVADPTIVRSRSKIEAAVANARTILELRERYGSFLGYVDSLGPRELARIAAHFKKQFKFMGPKIVESFCHSAGILPAPHDPHCWRAAFLTGAVPSCGCNRLIPPK